MYWRGSRTNVSMDQPSSSSAQYFSIWNKKKPNRIMYIHILYISLLWVLLASNLIFLAISPIRYRMDLMFGHANILCVAFIYTRLKSNKQQFMTIFQMGICRAQRNIPSTEERGGINVCGACDSLYLCLNKPRILVNYSIPSKWKSINKDINIWMNKFAPKMLFVIFFFALLRRIFNDLRRILQMEQF